MNSNKQLLEETSVYLSNAEINVRRQFELSSGTIGQELIDHILSAERLVELQIRRNE